MSKDMSRVGYRHAFTLIELLVVIAIIAILSVVVFLALNPAELLRKVRDSNRLSDFATTQSLVQSYATLQGGSLGSTGVTYVSIPDPTATTTAGTDCSGLGGNFTGGGSFHCPASSTFRNTDGTGWIPVNFSSLAMGSPVSQLPVDPTNNTGTNEYYIYQTDGSTFKIENVPESQTYIASAGVNPTSFMSGSNLSLDGGRYWVLVPGNSTFGTNTFWVMKYDAVCSNGQGSYINDNNTGFNTYNNAGLNCTSANNRQIASLPGGWQVTGITQTTAAAYCASIGAHLLKNAEWQTIAWNAEQVSSNWSGGSPGSGYLYAGHNDNAPAVALPGDPNDGNNYSGETNTGGSQKRTLTLSNGSVIWDMSGNVYQWTNDTITGTNEPHGAAAGFNWYSFTDGGMNYNGMTQATVGPVNSGWNSTQDIGQMYSENATDGTTYGFIRGANWGGATTAGIEAFSLNSTPTSTAFSFGFRCAR
jgi:prepilin-type N-terminal cleavage/methylation domain-containing protein